MNARVVMVGIAVVVLGLIGLRALADATLTTHQTMAPNSRTTVVISGSRGAEAEHPLVRQLTSLAHHCELEVGATIVPGSIERLDDRWIRMAFEPGLDEADQRQFRGCIRDLVVDHLKATVDSSETVTP